MTVTNTSPPIPGFQPFQLSPPIHLHPHLDQVGRTSKELTSSSRQHATRNALPTWTQDNTLGCNVSHETTTAQSDNAAQRTTKGRSRRTLSQTRHPLGIRRIPFLIHTLQEAGQGKHLSWAPNLKSAQEVSAIEQKLIALYKQ